jgi:uncharacterized protein YegP (UPF0339 family)
MFETLKSIFGRSKYEVQRNVKGEWYFRLKASNGEIVLTSESYENKTGVTKGIDSVKLNATDRENFEIRDSKDGKTYFVLKAKNGEIIGMSETYESKDSALKTMDTLSNISQTDNIKYLD